VAAKIQTVITNTSGASRFFGYLGPRGKTLANNGTHTVSGDIRTTMTATEAAALDRDETAGDITVALQVTSSSLKTSDGVGAANGTGVSAVEYGDGAVHKTVLTLDDVAIALTDEAGVVAYGGLKVYDFPAGAIVFLGATADLAVTKSSAGVNATWDGDFGLGTVTASNNATLASTEQNLIPTTATPQAVDGATTAKGLSTSTESGVVFNGTSTAIDAFLNVLVDDADHDVTGTACNLIFNGTITLVWANLGDI
jgi:hypothetical protein